MHHRTSSGVIAKLSKRLKVRGTGVTLPASCALHDSVSTGSKAKLFLARLLWGFMACPRHLMYLVPVIKADLLSALTLTRLHHLVRCKLARATVLPTCWSRIAHLLERDGEPDTLDRPDALAF